MLEQFKQWKGKEIKVGILGTENSETAEYAAANEFGTDKAGRNRKVKIPERSFLRSTFDDREAQSKIFETADEIFNRGADVKKIVKPSMS